MNLFDMTQSVLGEKPQWYAGEIVVLHQNQHSRAFLKECDCHIDLWLCVNSCWAPTIEVAILHPAQGWIPLKSFSRQACEAWVDRTRKLLAI
jgi:hypothetical protein